MFDGKWQVDSGSLVLSSTQGLYNQKIRVLGGKYHPFTIPQGDELAWLKEGVHLTL
jgi:hypothetical protein